MTWSAILNSASWANACPVLGFRSHMGKLLLVISISGRRGRRVPTQSVFRKTQKARHLAVPGLRVQAPSAWPRLDWLHVLCLEPLGPLGHVEADLLTFRESAKTLRADGRVVAKDVLAAIVLRDETETLRIVEPLHCTGCHALPSQSQTVNPPAPRAFWRGAGRVSRWSAEYKRNTSKQ